ncbi:hypothetical protein T06_536 [Trichinella sp. T6]|nr:hypothetical protein T06_536 [Trichinella sp. T6]
MHSDLTDCLKQRLVLYCVSGSDYPKFCSDGYQCLIGTSMHLPDVMVLDQQFCYRVIVWQDDWVLGFWRQS